MNSGWHRWEFHQEARKAGMPGSADVLVGSVEEHLSFPHDIFGASESGSTWLIGRYLGKGVDVNAKDEVGLTPLMHAVARNKLSAAEYLISKGADVNAHYYDATALSFALMNQNAHMIDLLLDHGAEGNDREKNWLQRAHGIKR